MCCWVGANDRRRYQRLKVSLFVWFRLDSHFQISALDPEKEIEATTIDFSQEGMAFATRYDIPAHAKLAIKLLLTRTDKLGRVIFQGPLELTGEVRSNLPLDGNEHRLGIYFSGINMDSRISIDSYISSLQTPV